MKKSRIFASENPLIPPARMATKTQLDLCESFEYDNLYSLYVARRGQTPLFTSPAQIRAAFDDYVAWCREHPIMVADVVKSGANAGTPYEYPRRLMVTEFGFTQYIGAGSSWFYDREKIYKANVAEFGDAESEAFLDEIATIRAFIRDDMDKGAVSGIYDANYVGKLRGLRDLRDVTSDGGKIKGAMTVQVLNSETAENLKLLKKVAKKREKKGDNNLDTPKDEND